MEWLWKIVCKAMLCLAGLALSLVASFFIFKHFDVPLYWMIAVLIAGCWVIKYLINYWDNKEDE